MNVSRKQEIKKIRKLGGKYNIVSIKNVYIEEEYAIQSNKFDISGICLCLHKLEISRHFKLIVNL